MTEKKYEVKRVGTGYFVVDEKGAPVSKCYAGQRGKRQAENLAKLKTSRSKIGNIIEG